VIPISVVVTVLPDNNRFVTISAVSIPKVFAVTIAIPMALTHGNAMRAANAPIASDDWRPQLRAPVLGPFLWTSCYRRRVSSCPTE
jgi:hypothetical protein